VRGGLNTSSIVFEMQNHTRLYFDNAATTPLLEAARLAMQPHLENEWGNASSPYALGRNARMAVDRARAQVACLIGAYPDEIAFTSGGTESDNWALLGVALAHWNTPKRHVILSAIEHHAVLETGDTLRELGFEVEHAPVDDNGVCQPQSIENLIRPETVLISVMAVNNETGVCQPIEEIAVIARANNIALHCDAVQMAGKMPLDVTTSGADLLTLSAHKIGGPKGAGALWIRRGQKSKALLRGGGQERGRRAGTENVAAIAGFGAAAQIARENLESNTAHLSQLHERLENGLLLLPQARISGAGAQRAPHITNVSLSGIRAESLALNLDLRGIAIGTGSACASGALEPSHVLGAMGLGREEAKASLRISLSPQNTQEEVDELLQVLSELINGKKP
jgi:cysteine desulfurase